MNTEIPKPTTKTRVLILGGGFGGLYAALQLEKTIAADENIEVILVRTLDLFFPPDLVQYVTVRDVELLHEHLTQIRKHPLQPL